MKKLIVAILAISLVGCASAASTDYYGAMEKAAQAQAIANASKYEALAKLAQSNDPGAAAAAVMAIALTKDTPVIPQYVESSALKWAQVLTPTVGTLGLGLIQAGVSKNASDNATQVQMASFASNQAIQMGQQQMVTDLGGQWSATASAGGAAVVELGLAGFNALNNAGDQTVTMGTAGLTAVTDVATVGFGTVDSVATTGMTGIVDVSTAGMTNLTSLGTTGMTLISDTGIAGMTALNTANTTNAGTISDIMQQYQTTISGLNTTIDSMATDLGQTVVCADDGTGTIVCN